MASITPNDAPSTDGDGKSQFQAQPQPHLRQDNPETAEVEGKGIADIADIPDPAHSQAVRFSSVNQEIEPLHSLQSSSTTAQDNPRSDDRLTPEAQAEIRNLSRGLQESHLQHRRMSHFAFEPVSLPVSRATSSDTVPQENSKQRTRSGRNSPRTTPPSSSMHTPPLTPAATPGDEPQINRNSPGTGLCKVPQHEVQITPQTSGHQKTPPLEQADQNLDSRATSISGVSRPSSASAETSSRPTSISQGSGKTEALAEKAPKFSIGSDGDSFPPSRDPSPTGIPRPGSGTLTPPTNYSRPFTPVGDQNDPYARSKRPPQPRNPDQIDARFIFGGRDSRRQSGLGSAAASLSALPRSRSGNDLKSQEKHSSTFSLHSLAGKKDHHGHLHDDSSAGLSGKQHGSMSDLKRFLRIGQSREKGSQPSGTIAKSSLNKTGTRTPPPHQLPPSNVPFADDHGLQSKYGKFGKVLGSGAGGSVRLMKRSSDGVTFAVKQFRDKHNYETEREYAKKVTAEFCIGSTLHHGNIIETLDIIHERGHWYEVMEFAPFDLFAIVMTGKMSREEVACSFLQIFSGVTYLHSMGLAHRDLKLDNVVVNEHGIMKLIDFGSATVYRYPFENDIVLATGVVGSDPYLAPEVYDEKRYDPQPADIWSLAIIFACMSLRRFPWKAPRVTDNSYKLFISPPTPGQEDGVRRLSDQRPKSMLEMRPAVEETKQGAATDAEATSQAGGSSTHQQPTVPGARIDGPKPEAIRGPWRLLRLLPRESRSIMGRMLQVNPRKRATLEEMLDDPWIANTAVCRQVEGGHIIPAEGHAHTLEPGTTTTSAATPSKK